MASYYESDITRMMKDLLERKPEIVADQKKGRSMWWDKKPEPELRKAAQESRVRQQAYVYQNKV